jgi:hypothetical protein
MVRSQIKITLRKNKDAHREAVARAIAAYWRRVHEEAPFHG